MENAIRKAHVNVDYSEICWFHGENSRADSFNNPLSDIGFTLDKYYIALGDNPDNVQVEEKQGGLVTKLYGGWNIAQGLCTVQNIADYAKLNGITVDEVTKRVKEEQARLVAEWDSKPETAQLAVTARNFYAKAKVKYIANECYRRSVAVMGVIFKRETDRNIPMDERDNFEIPCRVVQFASQLDRIISHTQENTLKDAGRQKYSALDYVKVAYQIARANGKESDLLKAGLKRGTAQQVFGVARLCDKYPMLKIMERLQMTPPALGSELVYHPDGYIPLSKLDKEEVRRLMNGYRWDDKEQVKPMNITPDLVENYIETKVEGRMTKPQAMSAPAIKTDVFGSPVQLISLVGLGIIRNDKPFFVNIKAYADEINAALAPILDKMADLPNTDIEATTLLTK